MLDRYNFKLKIGCDSLLQNVILREIINILLYIINGDNQ